MQNRAEQLSPEVIGYMAPFGLVAVAARPDHDHDGAPVIRAEASYENAGEPIDPAVMADLSRSCAETFVELQDLRHRADHNPTIKLSRAEALQAVELAERAIRSARNAPRRDRVAFAALLLFRRRP